ncbi:hypothetical protein HYPSUDRAFT_36697 [Hypholoma sublateritium FD-334 SS-4]|uniref:Uncharacterized protein n=1 Tax=Hypholoma sublateritium (strain FD-334 SS-4) TaxID=945553 RepID=A0A0D2LFF9_HYPSF|nr:hypothetical protein HYPSUDRAFT_36697 [Hypholoma sublateritium FD-334 SS-4]
MEQDDGAWTASVYAVFQPALPAYMERRPTSAARPPLATFAAAHTTVVIPPIDNDLAADGMDTKEHAGYLYDTSSELSFCVPDSDIYTCAPVAPAYSAQDVVMQDADTAVEGALSAEDAAVVAAMAGDPELMQLLDEELDAQMAEMAAAVAAEVVEGGWTGVVDEGESEQARAGEVPGVAPSDSQRHAEAPRPAAASLLHAESNDDEEEAQVARPRRAEKGRASHRVHPKHARGSAAPPRERTTRVRAAPTTVRTSASTREPRPARARASASPRAAPPALPTPTPVGADTQARRPTVKLRSGAVVEGGETTPPRAKKTAHPNSWVEDALIDVAAARRHLTETRPPPTPLLRRILSRKVECLKKENPKASIKDLAAKFPGRFTPFDVDRATPSPARPAAAFASTPANKAFGFNFPVGAAKAAAAAPEPSIAAVLPPGPTVSRAAFSTTPPDTAAGASHAPAAQEAPPVVHQTPGPEPAQADADATETSAVEELLAKVAALEVPDLIDFLSPLAVAHESEAQTDDASAPAAHAQAAATQTPPASTPDERAQEALEAEHRPQVKKQTRKQRRAAAAAAVEAVAALDESHDAIRPSNAQRNRVYGHRYRPYPGVAEPASTGREVPGSQAHAAEAPCKVYRPPTPDAAPAPVVVEKVRVKGRPVEMVEEVEEDEEPKVGLAPDGPILVYIGGNVASAAADAPAQDVMVEIEVEIEEPEAVAATKPVETHVEPASHVQPDEAVDSDTDDSADDVSDAGDSDEDVVSEDELDDNFGDARVVMPGDFFFANPPPSNPPALWPLGATIGVVSAVAFVGYRYA